MPLTKANLLADIEKAEKKDLSRHTLFYKMGSGEYAHHDCFRGIPNPTLRVLAKKYSEIDSDDLVFFLTSKYNEDRLLALLIMVNRYQKGDEFVRKSIVDLYLEYMSFINNWNLVDISAYHILGNFCDQHEQDLLLKLSGSSSLWHRRIAIVSTLFFIKKGHFQHSLNIVCQLMNDSEDLIHKACGWMLREIGKKNIKVLIQFLDEYAVHMPRVMLRYAIEKFSVELRKHYLSQKKL